MTVELLKNNEVIGEQIVQVDTNNQCLYTFEDLLKYDDSGNEN
ncbi:Cna B-type domain-containing protein [Carnobacterium maltaromaticum]